MSESVTSHMRTTFAHLRKDDTVGQAIESLRTDLPEGRVLYFYVLDEERRVCGVVPTRRLLLSRPETPVQEIMVRRVIVIPAAATILDACEFFLLHRLLAFPVVDEQGRMIGVVDVEFYTDEITDLERRDRSDDLFQLIGVHLTEAQRASPWSAYRNRFPWLICNIAGGLLAAFVTGWFEADLRRVVELALFVPVVLALAESVSVQSVSIAIQVMQGRQPTWATFFTSLRRELVTGWLLGVSCAAAVATVAGIWIGRGDLAFCLLLAITGAVTFAAMLGIGLPTLLRVLRRDPRVAAGPIVLAVADMATLLLYFGLARALLR